MPALTRCPGGEIGRRKGLESKLSTRLGNGRVNGVKFGGTAARQGGCNTELSPGLHRTESAAKRSNLRQHHEGARGRIWIVSSQTSESVET
jgi:hypothetical protein